MSNKLRPNYTQPFQAPRQSGPREKAPIFARPTLSRVPHSLALSPLSESLEQAKLSEANKCLFVLRGLSREGYVLSKLTYGLSIYGASKAYLVVMDYNSEKLSIYDLLKQSDRKLCDKISKEKHHPLYSILPNVRGSYQRLPRKTFQPDLKLKPNQAMLIYKYDITLNVIFNLTFFYDFGNFRNVFYRLNQDDDDDDYNYYYYYYYYYYHYYYFYVHNFIPTCFCASQKDDFIGKFIT